MRTLYLPEVHTFQNTFNLSADYHLITYSFFNTSWLPHHLNLLPVFFSKTLVMQYVIVFCGPFSFSVWIVKSVSTVTTNVFSSSIVNMLCNYDGKLMLNPTRYKRSWNKFTDQSNSDQKRQHNICMSLNISRMK